MFTKLPEGYTITIDNTRLDKERFVVYFHKERLAYCADDASAVVVAKEHNRTITEASK